ncbi:MAG: hypothetical protein IPM00_16105 [Tetrasphaera sp.]|nr:hypothetical protein [Tetrasphaera sp.]
MITIRSRSRHVRLRTPSRRRRSPACSSGVTAWSRPVGGMPRAPPSRIGMARRLARDEGRPDPASTTRSRARIRDVGDAIDAAADWHKIATEESGASAAERNASELRRLLETLGRTRQRAPNHRTSARRSTSWRREKSRATRLAGT